MSKKIVFILLCCIVIFTGCERISYKNYYNDIQEYEDIWTLEGFQHGYEGPSALFPQTLSDLRVVDYFCRHDQYLPFGEGIQIFLNINYQDKIAFEDEVARIQKLSVNCDESFDLPGFSCFYTNFEDERWYEYALIDTETQNVYYIYLSDISETQIEIDKQYLPKSFLK